ncbi:SDR family NAD(P)-dependent oxidoreductase [Paracoccus sp. (in: a-proteobacteria)]|uniref:SDR family NAD(P)-dependent oxidoreductase n=1 Tax=Paracoccus sp. TaxID=267 RepID=UPI003A8534E5
MRLSGKTAIITGAAGNIGLATARAYHREGANLVLSDLSQEALEQATTGFAGERVALVAGDVTEPALQTALADAAESRFGKVDIFFGNAGIEGKVATIAEYENDVFDKVMEVNVRSLFLGLKAISPRMADGGSVILTSSIMGISATPMNIGYSAAKHAVNGLMRSASTALGPRGIRVNTIHPGLVESAMLRRLINAREDPAAFEREILAKCKIARFVEPADIAETVVFLGADESRMITSQMICIDAGYIV